MDRLHALRTVALASAARRACAGLVPLADADAARLEPALVFGAIMPPGRLFIVASARAIRGEPAASSVSRPLQTPAEIEHAGRVEQAALLARG